MRAATLTPVGSAGTYLARLPVDGGLPRSAGGSAPTSDTFEACSVFARAAARMARWPPTGAVSRSASDHSSPPDPLRVLPAGARVAGWDLHPRNQCTFARHTAERGRACWRGSPTCSSAWSRAGPSAHELARLLPWSWQAELLAAAAAAEYHNGQTLMDGLTPIRGGHARSEDGVDVGVWLRGLGLGRTKRPSSRTASYAEVLPHLTADDLHVDRRRCGRPPA
jgi:hypothetical protein